MEIEQVSLQSINALFTFLNYLENTVLWMCTPNYEKQLYLNEGFQNIWGRPCEQLFQDLQIWRDTIFPEDLKQINAQLYKRHEQANNCSRLSFRIHRPDGECRWIKSTAHTIFTPEGKPAAIIGIDESLSPKQWNDDRAVKWQTTPLLSDLSNIISRELKLITLPVNPVTSKEPKKLNHIIINNLEIALTNRESQCLQHLLEGKSAKETAYILKISTRTVEIYLENLRKKANCRTKIALIGRLQRQQQTS